MLTRKEDSSIVSSLGCYFYAVGSMGKEVKPEGDHSVEWKAAGTTFVALTLVLV